MAVRRSTRIAERQQQVPRRSKRIAARRNQQVQRPARQNAAPRTSRAPRRPRFWRARRTEPQAPPVLRVARMVASNMIPGRRSPPRLYREEVTQAARASFMSPIPLPSLPQFLTPAHVQQPDVEDEPVELPVKVPVEELTPDEAKKAFLEYKQKMDTFKNKVKETFKCGICLELLYKPVMLSPCGHKFCSSCISQLLRTLTTARCSCPCCRRLADYIAKDFQLTEHLNQLAAAFPELTPPNRTSKDAKDVIGNWSGSVFPDNRIQRVPNFQVPMFS